MKRCFFAVLVLMSGAISLHAQHQGHHHERNEIGISTGAIYSFEHSEWGTGVHLHYFRTLGDHSKWAIGAMGEYAWVDGGHATVGAGVKYQILDKLSIGLLPGVTFLKHKEHENHGNHSHLHKENKTQFSAHAEVVYDLFHWDRFHLGPVIDYSWTKDDAHGMIGIHGAFCF